MSAHKWFIRSLLVVALGSPLLLIVIATARTQPDASTSSKMTRLTGPSKETDLARVYSQLPKENNFHELKLWCGLAVSVATPGEVIQIQFAMEASLDANEVCFFGYKRNLQSKPGEYYPTYDRRWYRLQNPADPSRWIGIKTDISREQWITCRVAMGFDPKQGITP